MTILRVVFESFTSERIAGDEGVHGFVRVHRAFAELRQAEGEREQGEDEKNCPADF